MLNRRISWTGAAIATVRQKWTPSVLMEISAERVLWFISVNALFVGNFILVIPKTILKRG